MTKVSKLLNSLFLGGFILMASPQKAESFGFFPPTPPEPVADIPGNIEKVISQVMALQRQYSTIKTQMKSLSLDGILGGIMGEFINAEMNHYTNGPKTPGKGKMVAADIGGTHIEEGDLSETNYYDAFTKLFLTMPIISQINGKDVSYQVVRTAYKRKSIEYQQDIIIDTYLAGRLTEDYLNLVDNTISRLESCQKTGNAEGGCTFFGMKFEEVGSNTSEPGEGNQGDSGLLGAARNTYIITVVYDKLMRIVEDLTATEALYRSSKQLPLINPVPRGGSQSSAEDYTNRGFKFAYHQEHESVYADDVIISKFTPSKECKGESSKDCPVASNKKAEDMKNMDSAESLGKLQQIDVWLQQALILHNLKVQLPEYKSQYRKYLKSIDMHKKAIATLQQSDKCVNEFLTNYRATSTAAVENTKWGAPQAFLNASSYEAMKEANDYENRTGISQDLILEYQKNIDDVIIGTTPECKGYVANCPEGYEQSDVCEAEGEKLYKCRLKMIERDSSEDMAANSSIETLYEDSKDEPSTSNANSTFNDADYLSDASQLDKMSTDSRIQVETTWQIGKEKIMELTKNHYLEFAPWHDQQELQRTYLNKKYSNIKKIISSIDEGVAAFKIAKALSENASYSDHNSMDSQALADANKYVRAITRCKQPSTVTAADITTEQPSFCSNAASGTTCPESIVGNNGNGTVTATKKVIDGYTPEGTPIYTTKSETWSQKVSLTNNSLCTFTQTPKELVTTNAVEGCPGSWDLTPSFLVKKYFSAVKEMGNCQSDPAEAMRVTANGKDRVVSQDKLKAVIDRRIANDNDIRNFIRNYNTWQTNKKTQLARKKAEMNSLNETIDKATKKKNIANKEKIRSENRMKSIQTEKDRLKDQKDLPKVASDVKELCAIDIQIMKLEFEKAAIEGKAIDEIAWESTSNCVEAVAKMQEETGQTLKKPLYGDKPDVKEYSLRDAENASDSAWVANPYKIEDINIHIIPHWADKAKTEQDAIIAVAKTSRESLKVEIKKLEEEITKAAEIFADPDGNAVVTGFALNQTIEKIEQEKPSYIALATEKYSELEEANDKYEDFLESGKRMQHKTKTKKVCSGWGPWESCKNVPVTYPSDNLTATMKTFLYEDKAVTELVKQGINDTWWTTISINNTLNKLRDLGIPDTFATDGSVPSSLLTLAGQIKDEIVEYAVNKIANNIDMADKAIKAERERAETLVENYAKSLGVCDDNCGNLTAAQWSKISTHSNYDQHKEGSSIVKGSMISGHESLINNLRTPGGAYAGTLNTAGITDLSDVFGIPSTELYDGIQDDNLKYRDDKYFVALPARGNNYLGHPNPVCTRDSDGTPQLNNEGLEVGDCGAGRDFRAPQGPLLNLPPLREVFYFSPQDYYDIPRKDNVPSITHLLNLRYPGDAEHKWEYMPEIWQYLLARPNMRNGYFQQTFEERSFGNGTFEQLIPSDNNYRAIIARGGVYPCLLDGQYYDIEGSDDVDGLKFKTRASLPTGVSKVPNCYEIARNKKAGTVCNTYNSGKKGICHLLADHGKNKDTQTDFGTTRTEMFKNYSELGQFLYYGSGQLRYRPLQQNIHEKLTNQNDSENTIDRQKAETALFKRNLFGSFLEAVNSEHSTKKNMDNAESDIQDSMRSLCKQLHSQDRIVSDNPNEKEPEDCNSECQEQHAQICVDYIMSKGGLAVSAYDDSYGVTGEYTDAKYNTIDCSKKNKYCRVSKGSTVNSYYECLFCTLDEWQDKLIDKVKHGGTDDKGKFAMGFNAIKSTYANDLSRIDERVSDIENNIKIFENDPLEIAYISQGTKADKVSSEVSTNKANKTAARRSDDNAIKSMDNQGQVVPYCPTYIYK